MIPLPRPIATLIDAAAARHQLDTALARAVAWVESQGQPRAVSPAGAMGIMQLMPRTAASLGVADPFNPAANIDGGVRFLAQLVRDFRDVPTALAAYNWGPANVRSGKARPSSVAAYIGKVLARMDAERAQVPDQRRSAPARGAGAAWFAALAVVALLGLLIRDRRS